MIDAPIKLMADQKTLRCCATCADSSMRFTRFYQCSRRSVVVRDEKPYCKIHDPIYKKQKRDAREAKWRAQWKRRDEDFAADRKTHGLFPRLYTALLALNDKVKTANWNGDMSFVQKEIIEANKILDEAKPLLP